MSKTTRETATAEPSPLRKTAERIANTYYVSNAELADAIEAALRERDERAAVIVERHSVGLTVSQIAANIRKDD